VERSDTSGPVAFRAPLRVAAKLLHSLMFITLTTDFGISSPYVAAMKGVLLGINPNAKIVDLSHSLPAQKLRPASYFLAQAVPYFPPDTLHVCVVDPGVGSRRALIYVEAGTQRILAPDNGVLTEVVRVLGGAKMIRQLTEPKYWRSSVSSTFHGRDILAPAAGHISLGVSPTELGPVMAEMIKLDTPAPRQGGSWFEGEVTFVDDFGNLISNFPASILPPSFRVTVAGQEISRFVRTYSEAQAGELVTLISSDGHLEIAVVNGNAAQHLRAASGTVVMVTSM
jgi:S-adenosylmethionine hydrolase